MEKEKSSNSYNMIKFEKVVGEILIKHYKLKNMETIAKNQICDFETEDGVIIEVKYSMQNNLIKFLHSINNILLIHGENIKNEIIFVTNLTSEDNERIDEIKHLSIERFNKTLNIIYLENLLYLCDGDEDLKTSLIQCINFSTEKIVPRDIDDNVKQLLDKSKKKKDTHNSNKTPLSEELNTILKGRDNFNSYEEFCNKFISKIFENNIDKPIIQKVNNDGLYRFDIVASIKKDPESFWKFIYDKFNSCFILFECKNYTNKITQNEIYTTERYLYNNALRNVAIILTRIGAENNAYKACQGILKEHGKFILILNDEDLKNLDKLYIEHSIDANNPSPSDYLLDKAKDFLLNLDK